MIGKMLKKSPTPKTKTIVISLGGSIIIPNKIQTEFLKDFRRFILKFLKRNFCFVIVTGGGNICREYQNAASQITKITDEDRDWLGIHATRLNAHLIRTIFKNEAYPVVLDNPLKRLNGKNYKLFIGSGWRPGWSTDYDAVLLAKRFKAEKIITASNIDYVYEKDIAKFKGAKPIKDIKWSKYRKLIESNWKPGMKAPIDPIASSMAEKLKMNIVMINGTNLENFEKILENKEFKGTVIHP